MLAKYGIVLLFLGISNAKNKESQHIFKSCYVGDTTENDCVKCICTTKNIYECIPKNCNESALPDTNQRISCRPDMIYVLNSTSCICNKTGNWPHQKCSNIFRSFPHDYTKTCNPNDYVIEGCNVCKCGPDGYIHSDHCTKNKCRVDIHNNERRFEKGFRNENEVYGNCEAKTWYSLAPCQFCYCVAENKLFCNTGHRYSQKVQLGSYNLSVCGANYIKEALGLVPQDEISLRLNEKVENDKPETTTVSLPRNVVKQTLIGSLETEHVLYGNISDYQVKGKNQESDAYDTGSDENQISIPPKQKFIETATVMNAKDILSDNSQDGSDDSENRENVGDEIDAKSQTTKLPQSKHFETPIASKDNYFEDILKPYLPSVIDKIFRMALRKSMVSIDSDANCKRGETTVIDCNVCFCMDNNKLLCTRNDCSKISQ